MVDHAHIFMYFLGCRIPLPFKQPTHSQNIYRKYKQVTLFAILFANLFIYINILIIIIIIIIH